MLGGLELLLRSHALNEGPVRESAGLSVRVVAVESQEQVDLLHDLGRRHLAVFLEHGAKVIGVDVASFVGEGSECVVKG